MIDAGEQDNKILGVQADNPRFDNIKDISDIEKIPHSSLEGNRPLFSDLQRIARENSCDLRLGKRRIGQKEIAKARGMYKDGK